MASICNFNFSTSNCRGIKIAFEDCFSCSLRLSKCSRGDLDGFFFSSPWRHSRNNLKKNGGFRGNFLLLFPNNEINASCQSQLLTKVSRFHSVQNDMWHQSALDGTYSFVGSSLSCQLFWTFLHSCIFPKNLAKKCPASFKTALFPFHINMLLTNIHVIRSPLLTLLFFASIQMKRRCTQRAGAKRIWSFQMAPKCCIAYPACLFMD